MKFIDHQKDRYAVTHRIKVGETTCGLMADKVVIDKNDVADPDFLEWFREQVLCRFKPPDAYRIMGSNEAVSRKVGDVLDQYTVKIDNEGRVVGTGTIAGTMTSLDSGARSRPHPHAKNMQKYAEDAAVTRWPWQRWQCRSHDLRAISGWTTCPTHPEWRENADYRRNPKFEKGGAPSEDPADSEDVQTSDSIYNMVIDKLRRDLETNGRFSRVLSRTFNLDRRQGRSRPHSVSEITNPTEARRIADKVKEAGTGAVLVVDRRYEVLARQIAEGLGRNDIVISWC